MTGLSPGCQLLLLAAFAVLLRYVLGRQGALPTPAAAAVMAIGIFIAAPLQRIPTLDPLLAESMAIALLVIWAFVAASYVVSACRGTLHEHSRPLVARFAIGTWIAATAVLARVILLELPDWQAAAIALAILAFAIWLWFVKLAASAVPDLAKTSSQRLVPGVVLLSTVSTQSLALVALDLLPSGPILSWVAMSLIGAGVIFYAIGLVLIVRSHMKVAGWTLAEDWDNTNCILHGAMSITGLALVSYGALPPTVTLLVWYYAFCAFLAVESVEALRMALRVKKHGWRRGIFSYRVTQWSRNFTFGMFYAFTLQLFNLPEDVNFPGWVAEIQSLILVYGPYIVLMLLLVEIALYCKSRFYDGRIPAINPWSRNRFIRRTPPQRSE